MSAIDLLSKNRSFMLASFGVFALSAFAHFLDFWTTVIGLGRSGIYESNPISIFSLSLGGYQALAAQKVIILVGQFVVILLLRPTWKGLSTRACWIVLACLGSVVLVVFAVAQYNATLFGA